MSPGDRYRDEPQSAEDRGETKKGETYTDQVIEDKEETEEWERQKRSGKDD
jgi:hypothetical protein